jgi:hypothetical protein
MTGRVQHKRTEDVGSNIVYTNLIWLAERPARYVAPWFGMLDSAPSLF